MHNDVFASSVLIKTNIYCVLATSTPRYFHTCSTWNHDLSKLNHLLSHSWIETPHGKLNWGSWCIVYNVSSSWFAFNTIIYATLMAAYKVSIQSTEQSTVFPSQRAIWWCEQLPMQSHKVDRWIHVTCLRSPNFYGWSVNSSSCCWRI